MQEMLMEAADLLRHIYIELRMRGSWSSVIIAGLSGRT